MKTILNSVKTELKANVELSKELREMKRQASISKQAIHELRVNKVRRKSRELCIIQNILKDRSYARCEPEWERSADWLSIYDKMISMGLESFLKGRVNFLAANNYPELATIIRLYELKQPEAA